ncbi:hypothetical protein DID88_009990 [Monilinia fructigena]|uniref:NADH dehydrogenase [ubiquinone] 1 alpha subcomplex subunit 13 n=2 Tax=Sclerotiniaceae TaxID=28983 RepID=A0A395IJW7_9HELO|nr:hypothetical protein DID88_009990 [Monilinia fructigena]
MGMEKWDEIYYEAASFAWNDTQTAGFDTITKIFPRLYPSTTLAGFRISSREYRADAQIQTDRLAEKDRRMEIARGFRPSVVLLAMAGVMTYGFWKVGKGIREQNELAREKMWSRIHLIPLLTAETDRDLVRRHWADLKREKELLGSETSPYNSDRYVRPTYAVTPIQVTKD